jgi:hypothetical protein
VEVGEQVQAVLMLAEAVAHPFMLVAVLVVVWESWVKVQAVRVVRVVFLPHPAVLGAVVEVLAAHQEAVLAESTEAGVVQALMLEVLIATNLLGALVELVQFVSFGQEQPEHSHQQVQEIYNGTFYSHRRWSAF